MKKINILLVSLFIASLTIGCNDEDEAEVFQNRDIAGVDVALEGYGTITGDPVGDELMITSTALHMEVSAEAVEDSTLVSKYEVVKQFNGGPEVVVASYESLPFTLDLTELDQFLEGTSVSEENIKIGDEFTFKIKQHQTDGDIYVYAEPSFNITVNCFADVAGMYKVTNSYCGEGSTGTIPLVEIVGTPDGRWYLETGDGGLLQYCSSNTSYVNDATISIICGEVQATTSAPYCPAPNGVGCITGGTWDEETGTLTLELTSDLWVGGAYTATYVKQ